MERNLFLCFLLTFLTQIEISVSESFLGNNFDDEYQQPYYPYSNLDCVCSRDGIISFLQCEGKFLVKLTDADLYFSSKCFLNTTCNETITSEDLRHDYPNLIGLQESKTYDLTLEDCPEPSISFVRQFFPLQKENIPFGTEQSRINKNGEIVINIVSLRILCVHRKQFNITKKHLESLSELRYFHVSCFALKSLPSDLFQGTTPNLETISITHTQIDEIPSRLFHNLKHLRMVDLSNNCIKKVNAEAFLGCRNLNYINMKSNQLTNLEERLLNTLENITHLYLSRNSFRVMPKNFKKLSKVRDLDLSQNQLEQINEEHCDGFSNLFDMNVSYNGLKHIHPHCFSENLKFLDISGNSLQNITENQFELNKLLEFYFKDNTILHLEIKQLFTSRKLYELYMSNSNVISLYNDTLHGFPSLEILDISNNNLSSIPEKLFVKNTIMKRINLQRNRISSLPSGLFCNNIHLYKIDLSWNRISVLPIYLFPQNCTLKELDLSFNRIENIPEKFLANITSLRDLKLSNNNITSLGKDFLMEMRDLDYLDLSYNSLLFIESDMFHPLNISLNLKRLYLQGNNISVFPHLRLEKLEYLDLSKNELSLLPENVSYYLPNLKELYISMNFIAYPLDELLLSHTTLYHTLKDEILNPWEGIIQHLYYILSQFKFMPNLETLDLSNNKFIDFPLFRMQEEFISFTKLTSIDLSNNHLTSFYATWIEVAYNLEKLNLSCNNINFFSDYPDPYRKPREFHKINMSRLKVLDISNNNLDLKYYAIQFEERFLTWGRVSSFHIFPNLEVLLLRNNSITSICQDWRMAMPNLKFLDLSYNKLHFLTHQDLIFRSVSVYEKIRLGPYHWPHKLTVDLRHNKIRFVELPHRMLAILPKKNETRGAYGHVTMLIEDNPFECGCALFNLLRVVRYDAVLTTQLKRVTGHEWVFSAKLDIGNLSCSTPRTVRGKKLNNTEEWLHHLIPLFGLCSLQDIF